MPASAALLLSAAVGFRAAGRTARRAQTLQTLVLLLERMEAELVYARTALPDMLLRLCGEAPFSSLPLLNACCDALRAGQTLPDAWNAGTDRLCGLLERWECVRLRQFGAMLGATDLPGQRDLFLQQLLFLRERRQAAEQQAERGGRLFRACGLCFGFLLFILIL